MTFKKTKLTLAAAAAVGIGAFLITTHRAEAQQQPAQAPAPLRTLHVQGNVWAIFGAGGNITVQAGPDGVLLVDTGLVQNADRVLAEIKKVSPETIRYIINTHVHPDHVGGNEKIAQAGATITGGNVTGDIGDSGVGAQIIAHENVLNRMSAPTGSQAPFPQKAWPNNTYFTAQKKMFFNGEALEIIHIPNAHTDGDSMVFFRKSDVISSGDVYRTNNYPIMDMDRGGNIQGIIAAMNRMIDISVPADKQEGGTLVIPGHGRICDQADLVEYRDMITIIRDRIQDGVKKGQTLAQIKAAKPTLDYDGVYGSTTGNWTTDQFIEAVYKSLTAAKK
jgi:cyclase